MTAASEAMAAAPRPIRDRGYARYEGPRRPGRGVVGIITRRTLRSLARQPWVLAMLILSAFPTVIWAVVLVVRSYIGASLPPDAAEGGLGLLAGREYLLNLAIKPYGALLITVLVSMFAGSGVIADDRRQGVLALYFARPVSARQYLLGKTLPVTLLVAMVCLLPLALIALIDVAVARSRADLWQALGVMPRALVFGAIETLLFALPAVALSALLRTRGAVQGAYALVIFLPWIVGSWLASNLRSPWPQLVVLPAQLESLGRWLLGVSLPEDARLLPPWAAAAALVSVLAGSLALLDRRVRRLEEGDEA